MKIAGVARAEVRLELLEFLLEEDLPSLSQAVGAALDQWLADRRRRRSSPSGADGDEAPRVQDGVLYPASSIQNPSSTEGPR